MRKLILSLLFATNVDAIKLENIAKEEDELDALFE